MMSKIRMNCNKVKKEVKHSKTFEFPKVVSTKEKATKDLIRSIFIFILGKYKLLEGSSISNTNDNYIGFVCQRPRRGRGRGGSPPPTFVEKITNLVRYISKNEKVVSRDLCGRPQLADLAGKNTN